MLNYKMQEMPDLHNSGKKVVYPKPVINRTLSTDDFIEKMRDYNFGHPAGTIKGVLADISTMMEYMMEMGYNVKLDGIGTFSLAIGFDDEKPNEMTSEDDKMLYRKVGVKNVNYKADPNLVKDLKQMVKLTRLESEVSTLQESKYSLDDRIKRAVKLIEKNGYITLTDYADINNISRTKASRELKVVCDKEDSPIKSHGNGSHKVWVKNEKE